MKYFELKKEPIFLLNFSIKSAEKNKKEMEIVQNILRIILTLFPM